MDDIKKEFTALEAIVELVDELSYPAFISTMTVVMENYCRRHGYNPVDETDNLINMVRLAVELLGTMS